MIYAFDTYYFPNQAQTAMIGFEDWNSSDYLVYKHQISPIKEAYISGEFYKRELPGILTLIEQITLRSEDILLVDGYVYLDDYQRLGLGGHLYEFLKKKQTVIGIAKNDFVALKTNKRPVLRGQSKKPLYITAAGVDLDTAADKTKQMAGQFRIPDLLKQVDQLSRIEIPRL